MMMTDPRLSRWLAGFLLCLLTGVGHGYGQTITTIAGNGAVGYTGDGATALSATLDSPTCAVTDLLGNIYICDQFNSVVRRVSTGGIISTFAGTGNPTYNGDNIAATAANIGFSWGAVTDAAGNVYVSDQTNHRVRRISPAGIISTVAGNGTSGYTGDSGPATNAELKSPLGLALDASGNLYIGDPYSNCVRMVNAAGIITTFAGNGSSGFGGDGGAATAAQLNQIWGMAADASGNVYICDGGNNRVRKVSTSGIITSIAGTGSPGYGGDAGPAASAKLNDPSGICVAPNGVIYIADMHNNRIRRISTTGVISTVAGTGVMGFAGDGGLAATCELAHPIGISMDAAQNLYIADLDNVRIRKMDHVSDLTFTNGHLQSMTVCENTHDNSIDEQLAITDLSAGSTDEWRVLAGPYHGTAIVTYSHISAGGAFVPLGLSYTPATGYLGNDTLSVWVNNSVNTDTTKIVISVIAPVTSAGVITGLKDICVGRPVVMSDGVAGGAWTVSNGNASMSADTVTGIAEGRDTVVYTVSNACSSIAAYMPINIHALPPVGGITGPGAVCRGKYVLLVDTLAGGVWSAGNGNASVSAGIVTGQAYGYDTITYTVSDSFCTASTYAVIHIDTFPSILPIYGDSFMCIGASLTLSDSTDAGSWTIPAGYVSSVVSGKVATLTGVSAGATVVTYSFSNSCGTAYATTQVTVEPLPEIPVITQKMNVLYAPPGYAAYQWTAGISAIAGATQDTFFVLTAGSYGVTVVNNFGCEANSSQVYDQGCRVSDLNVYPNPVSSVLQVEWCNYLTARLLCMDGKQVGKYYGVKQIDMSMLPDATYLLVLYDKSGHKIRTEKIVKITR
jgi:NHL repeat